MTDKAQIFDGIDQSLINSGKPSDYINSLLESSRLEVYPFTMLGGLVRIEQSPLHHPEGNVWNHTMMVVDHAAERRHLSSDPRVLMWAALLHDLGKVPATKIRKGKITAYDHDKYGEGLAVRFLKEFTDDEEWIGKVAALVRWHMQILYVVKNLPFADIKSMLAQVSIEEIALLSLCDRLGRGGMDEAGVFKEEENVRIFVKKCEAAQRL